MRLAPTLQVLPTKNFDMAHHGHVKVIINGRPTYIRASTISRCLPCLWRRYVRNSPYMTSLRPTKYLYQAPNDPLIRTALRNLFEYLEEIDDAQGNSTRLLESLEYAWDTSGPRPFRAQGAFSALGFILLPENFGCNIEIWSTMETYVTRHCAEILDQSPFGWLEYIRVLDRIDEYKMFDLTNILSCFIVQRDIRLQDLQDIRWTGQMEPRPLKYLERLIRQRESRKHRTDTGFPCATCHKRIRQQEQYLNARNAWIRDLERRRGKSPPWAGRFDDDDDMGPQDQCEACFRVFGPLPPPRWALPRSRDMGLLTHAPHINDPDNYEIQRSHRPYPEDRSDMPRFFQPFVPDVGRWHPRHGHRVEIMS